MRWRERGMGRDEERKRGREMNTGILERSRIVHVSVARDVHWIAQINRRQLVDRVVRCRLL